MGNIWSYLMLSMRGGEHSEIPANIPAEASMECGVGRVAAGSRSSSPSITASSLHFLQVVNTSSDYYTVVDGTDGDKRRYLRCNRDQGAIYDPARIGLREPRGCVIQ